MSSFGRQCGKKKDDCRDDHEANWGKHVTRWSSPEGHMAENVKSWFGSTLHLVVAKYELPVEFNVFPASVNERPVARKMVDQIAEKNPGLLERCQHFCGVRGYDDKAMISKLWDEHAVHPIIDNSFRGW